MALLGVRIWIFTGVPMLLALHGMLVSFRRVLWLPYDTTAATTAMFASSTLSESYNDGNDHHYPPPPPLFIANPKQDAFAACLMFMDDNHRLAEWIPYHYLTMPLRHVVILVDENSTTSPTSVLEKWKPYITMEVWRNTTRLPRMPRTKGRPPRYQAVKNYLKRQQAFYYACATHLQQQGWTWTTFHDVDEFYVVAPAAVRNLHMNTTDNEDDDGDGDDSSSAMGQPGVILDTIRQVQDKMTTGVLPYNEHYEGPCITTHRILFGVNESSKEDVARNAPSHVVTNPQCFDTLRYRHVAKTPQIGKSLFNVQQFPRNITPTLVGAHKLVPTCPHAYYQDPHYLRIHHYLGSWASYMARPHDPRVNNRSLKQTKSKLQWEKAGVATRGPVDTVRPWIAAFCRHFGAQRTRYLLADVGVIVSGKNSSSSSSTTVIA